MKISNPINEVIKDQYKKKNTHKELHTQIQLLASAP